MKRLRDLREDADLNQMQVAKLLCCTQATYSRYESGELNIPIESLKILASYYNTSIDYITGFTDVKKPYKCNDKDTKK
jgi:transcriptional regulator with XRE-family HTH domain